MRREGEEPDHFDKAVKGEGKGEGEEEEERQRRGRRRLVRGAVGERGVSRCGGRRAGRCQNLRRLQSSPEGMGLRGVGTAGKMEGGKGGREGKEGPYLLLIAKIK